MGIETSHVWKRLKRGSREDQKCFFCGKIIAAGTKRTWKYDSPYRVEFGHPDCKEGW